MDGIEHTIKQQHRDLIWRYINIQKKRIPLTNKLFFVHNTLCFPLFYTDLISFNLIPNCQGLNQDYKKSTITYTY